MQTANRLLFAPTPPLMSNPASSSPLFDGLRLHYRWTSAVLFWLSAAALVGYAGLQVWLEFRHQSTQQRNAIYRVQVALERAMQDAAAHVQTMRRVGQAHWGTELARTTHLPAFAAFEATAPAGAPWDHLPNSFSSEYGSLFFDPTADEPVATIASFKTMVAAVMPLVATRHEQDKNLQWSYFYGAGQTLFSLYPALSLKQYLQVTDATDMTSALKKAFDAGGTQPLKLAGPQRNPSRNSVWTKPYIDAGGKGMMVSVLAPMYDAKGLFAVAGTDITLKQLDDILRSNPLGNARLWVVDEQGTVVAATHDERHQLRTLDLAQAIEPLSSDDLERQVLLQGWTLVVDTPSSALLQAALDRSSGWLMLALGVFALIALLLRMQRLRVVDPALSLAQYVEAVNENPGLPIPEVIVHWVPSFERVALRARERKAMMDEIAKKTEELELRVSERTADLRALNVQLKQAKQEAEEASAAKGNFLAIMSHEIRTPIHAITGMTYLLAEADLSPQQKEYVEEVNRANQHLLHLLNTVLDLAKIEAGKLELDKEPFDLDHVLDDVRVMFAQQMRHQGLGFEVRRLDDGPVVLLGDSLRLTQILVNLVNNAKKFTEVGAVLVCVSCQHSAMGKSRLKVEVKDTGIGLSEQQIQVLFKPFSQADKHINRRYGGTGLGLTISKAFVEAMGGSIGVSSAPGQGATFVVELSLPRLTQSLVPVGQALGAHRPLPCFEGKRVLLAEDNLVNQRIACEILQSTGIQVDLASDGASAVQQCMKQHYDIILMDVQMPDMDGLQATRLIREFGVAAPIIALTANTTLQDRNECLQAGMTDFLGKPFSPITLIDIVKKWLGQADKDSRVQAPSAST